MFDGYSYYKTLDRDAVGVGYFALFSIFIGFSCLSSCWLDVGIPAQKIKAIKPIANSKNEIARGVSEVRCYALLDYLI